MRKLLNTRVTPVWIGLMLAAALSLWLGADHGTNGHGEHALAGGVILAVALVKVRFIGMYFMELRHAPLPLKLAFNVWCAIVLVVILGLYLIK